MDRNQRHWTQSIGFLTDGRKGFFVVVDRHPDRVYRGAGLFGDCFFPVAKFRQDIDRLGPLSGEFLYIGALPGRQCLEAAFDSRREIVGKTFS